MLVTTDTELDSYATQPGMDINLLKPYLEMAEKRYLQKVLGKEQFTDLETAYQNSIKETPVALDQEDIVLLHYCRQVIVPLSFYLGADNLDVSVDATGIRRSENENKKTAYQYQKNDFLKNQFNLGLERMDNLYGFLEENIDDYPLYAASEIRAGLNKLLIRSLADFERQVSIRESFWLFLHLRDIMEDVELTRVIPNMGEHYETIKSKIDSDQNLTADENEILTYAKKTIANLSLNEVVNRLPVQLDSDGALMVFAENTKTINAKLPADDQKLNRLKEQYLNTGNNYFEMMVNKIQQLADAINETDDTAEESTGNYIGF